MKTKIVSMFEPLSKSFQSEGNPIIIRLLVSNKDENEKHFQTIIDAIKGSKQGV